jgi:hypothetical protein
MSKVAPVARVAKKLNVPTTRAAAILASAAKYSQQAAKKRVK